MSIVPQHQFPNLAVHDTEFENRAFLRRLSNRRRM